MYTLPTVVATCAVELAVTVCADRSGGSRRQTRRPQRLFSSRASPSPWCRWRCDGPAERALRRYTHRVTALLVAAQLDVQASGTLNRGDSIRPVLFIPA